MLGANSANRNLGRGGEVEERTKRGSGVSARTSELKWRRRLEQSSRLDVGSKSNQEYNRVQESSQRGILCLVACLVCAGNGSLGLKVGFPEGGRWFILARRMAAVQSETDQRHDR